MFFSSKEGFQCMVALTLYFITVYLVLKHLGFTSKYLFGKVLESGVEILFYFSENSYNMLSK